MIYQGCVTDISYNRALNRLPIWERKVDSVEDIKYWEGLDMIYSCGRFPRIFLDELGEV